MWFCSLCSLWEGEPVASAFFNRFQEEWPGITGWPLIGENNKISPFPLKILRGESSHEIWKLLKLVFSRIICGCGGEINLEGFQLSLGFSSLRMKMNFDYLFLI